MIDLEIKFKDLFNSIQTNRMIHTPSEYAERYRSLTGETSTVRGKFKYNLTPYTREIVECWSPYHPAKIVGVMKGAQSGLTDGVIVNGILWMIANNPGNTLFLSANDELSQEVIEMRLDPGIQSCGIQHLIRPNTIRKRNQRTGDTSKYKEYSGGRLYAGSVGSIVKLSHQRSIKNIIADDWDTAPLSDKKEGSLFELIQLRLSTAAKSMKQFYISTPKTKPSNIENVYVLGDQRKYLLPCPKCGDFIEIKWGHLINKDPAGIFFEKDDNGKLIEKSVGYICQSCGNFFKEKYKYEMNLSGHWRPTVEPSQEGFYSYQLNNFIGAPHMFNWTDYARQWTRIWTNGSESQSKRKVFRNQVEGLPWEERKQEIRKNRLIKNVRKYAVGTVPNKQSKDDGNGNIVLLTCACDINGIVDDARLDFDVWGWSENGSVYSINQGSIGTFQPGKKDDDHREKLTYRNEQPHNVWNIFFNEIVGKTYYTDEGNEMKIMITGVDTGYYDQFGFTFINDYPGMIVGVKGGSDDKFVSYNKDAPVFKKGKKNKNQFILETNFLKDQISEMINLRWVDGDIQPAGFMNFPVPTAENYTPKYFEQFEAEHKILEQNDDGEPTGWRWAKKTTTAQNHFFDTAVYNLALREIITQKFCKELKIPDGNYDDFVQAIKKIIGL